MKPVNIYGLTRVSETDRWERLERQMSGRTKHIKIKSWEMESLASLCERLADYVKDISSLDFYYSFTLPKLGKEFDLLRICEDSVVNIELKSREVSNENIKKQLLLNRYYLAMLNRTTYYFTYISSTRKLYRLSNAGRLIEADWMMLADILEKQKGCYTKDIENLFKENEYLISPLTDTGRFLRREYFLTSQQRDIKRRILKEIKRDSKGARDGCKCMGFTGYPGTGKTLLLYDLAMELSSQKRVCIFYFGTHKKELDRLDERLKRVDFRCCEKKDALEINGEYTALFLDEGHRIDAGNMETIMRYASEKRVPVIISYDSEAPIATEEQKQHSTHLIEALDGFIKFRLTNRIRLNNELSDFISYIMNVKRSRQRRVYSYVSLLYAKDKNETKLLMDNLINNDYKYIRDHLLGSEANIESNSSVDIGEATSTEFEKVFMIIDNGFYYDDDGFLRSKETGDGRVRHLYHGLNRAKKRIAVIVENNLEIFDRILGILQK